MITIGQEQYLNSYEFADMLNISVQTARKMMQDSDYTVQIGERKYVCLSKFHEKINGGKRDEKG